MRRLLAALALFSLASSADAEVRVSLGARAMQEILGSAPRESGTPAFLAGPAVEIRLGSWNAEMFTESADDREHFQLELRHAVRPPLTLIAGTRADRAAAVNDWDWDGEALFGGVRIDLEGRRLAPFASLRIFHGTTRVERFGSAELTGVHGYGVEAGLLIELPGRTFRDRSERFELLPSIEYEQLDSSLVDLKSARFGLRIRYAITRPR